MTVQNIIEEIKSIIPVIGGSIIIKEIDNAQKLFAEETRCLKKETALTSIHASISFALPADFLGLYRVDFYNSDGEPIYAGELNYSWEIEEGKFILKSTNSTPLTEVSSTVDAIYLTYYYQPADITTEAGSLVIDEEYHDAIKAKVLERLFAMYPVDLLDRAGNLVKSRDWQAVNYWKGEYLRLKINYKKHINMEDESDKIYSGIYKGGFVIPPKRTEL